ncbi:hypothetical protein P3G55_04830 [Leptospira sp. 96542]|nr:hypothetical protein [Leptospira sp. 96542]
MNFQEIEKLKQSAFDAQKSGNLDEAIRLMNEYLSKVDSGFTHPCHLFLAEIFFEKKEFENALSSLNQSITLSKNFLPAFELRTQIYEFLGNKTLQINDLKKIEEIKNLEKSKWDDPDHYYNYK